MPWYLSAKWPGLLVLAGIGLAFLPEPANGLSAAPLMVGVLWALLTGRARRTYWNARIRAMGYADERAARKRRHQD